MPLGFWLYTMHTGCRLAKRKMCSASSGVMRNDERRRLTLPFTGRDRGTGGGGRRGGDPPSWLLIAVLASLLTWVGWAVVLMIAVRIAS